MFNANEHLMAIRKSGEKDYLPVQWRLVWFREQYPHGKITTALVNFDSANQMAIFKATVEDGQGGFAEGHGSETMKDFRDFLEKAETKAIGRALAALGFGTQFAPELEEGERIVDAPVQRQTNRQQVPAPLASIPSFDRLRTHALKYIKEEQFNAAFATIGKPEQDLSPDNVLALQVALTRLIKAAKVAAQQSA